MPEKSGSAARTLAPTLRASCSTLTALGNPPEQDSPRANASRPMTPCLHTRSSKSHYHMVERKLAEEVAISVATDGDVLRVLDNAHDRRGGPGLGLAALERMGLPSAP